MSLPETVLDFWFQGEPERFRDSWFRADATFDAVCVSRFAEVLRDARAGALDHWADTPEGALALVIVLDQLSRNIHRGRLDAYAADTQALAVARAALARGFDRKLGPVQRVFLYLPFEHAESVAEQDLAVALFETLRGGFEGADATIDYAHRHRDVIRRFGRFPHRNAILGRDGTQEEQSFIAEQGSAF
jgi:uncharacterized protein (DUF924 family)